MRYTRVATHVALYAMLLGIAVPARAQSRQPTMEETARGWRSNCQR
jgi:hypothetical protein